TVFQILRWSQTHVAGLASVAHMLPTSVGVVRVASSDVAPPHGSHPDLDNLWGSGRVRLLNDEHDITRFEKIKEIVHWAPAQKFLKVCWENLSAELNCGKCEKCLRTQVAIKAAGGDLSLFDTFSEQDLPSSIEDLPLARPHLLKQWRQLCDAVEEPALTSAIENLLRRSTTFKVVKQSKIKVLLKRLLGRS
ncbi:MAG: hypothetical protein ABJQ14_09490, partial [Hyphomicrobiales bacterium]